MNDPASLFQRIDRVMERICGAPLIDIFKPPATEGMVAHVESVIGTRLPEDLRQAYLWHNGNERKHYMWGPAKALPSLIRPGFRWVDLDEVEDLWLMLRERDQNQREGENADLWITTGQGIECEGEPTLVSNYDEKRIPVANCDANAWAMVDLRPSPWGTSGQLVEECADDDQPLLIATSFTECLRRVVDALDDGRYSFDSEHSLWISRRTGQRPRTLDDF